MPSRRDLIRLDDAEVAAFLGDAKTIVMGTNGPRGLPHLMPLWYYMRGSEIWGWTFAKSQKAKNLERESRATLLVEDGVSYEKLRGVMLECEVELITDTAAIREIGIELFTRYGDGNPLVDEVVAMIEAQAPKRVGLRMVPNRTVSWDHGKLGGVY